MSEVEEAFQVLLYGEGAWIGLLLFMTVMIVIGAKSKWASILFIPLSVFIGISYLENVSVSSNFMWCAIMMFIMSISLTVRVTLTLRGR